MAVDRSQVVELVSTKRSQSYEASPLPQLNRARDGQPNADHDTDLELMSNHSEAGRDDTDHTEPLSHLRTSTCSCSLYAAVLFGNFLMLGEIQIRIFTCYV